MTSSEWIVLRFCFVAFVSLFGAAKFSLAQSSFFRTHPQSQFVTIGQTVTLNVSLGGAPSAFQWQKNGVNLPGATKPSLTLTIATAADAGNYSILVSDQFRSESSAPAMLYLNRLANFSVRATLSPGTPSITVGHGVLGRGSVTMVRAIGPTLAQFGVTDSLPDPRLTVVPTFPVFSNDGWSRAPNAQQIADEAVRLGAFALSPGSADAVVLRGLEGTIFSAEVGSASNSSGTVLVELYHADTAFTNRLVNVSARARIGTREGRITAGFVLVGETKTTLLIRAVGPSLATFGISRTLTEPKLELFRMGTSAPLATNDHWGGSPELKAQFVALGAFPLAAADSRDAALLVTLEPGVYSVQVTGVEGSTGEALIELYLRE